MSEPRIWNPQADDQVDALSYAFLHTTVPAHTVVEVALAASLTAMLHFASRALLGAGLLTMAVLGLMAYCHVAAGWYIAVGGLVSLVQVALAVWGKRLFDRLLGIVLDPLSPAQVSSCMGTLIQARNHIKSLRSC